MCDWSSHLLFQGEKGAMGEPGPRGPYGLPVSPVSRGFPPARVDNLLLAQLTLPRGQANPIRGARSNPLIPFNTSVTVCFRDRSYLCRILTLRYTHPCASQD